MKIGRFLKQVLQRWPAIVSGGLSVPFAAAAIYFQNLALKTSFAMLSFLGVVVAMYSVWSSSDDRSQDAAARIDRLTRLPFLQGEIEEMYSALYSPEQLQGEEVRCDVAVILKILLNNASECRTTTRSFGLTVMDSDGIHQAEYLGYANKCVLQWSNPHQGSSGGVVDNRPEHITDLGIETASIPVERGIHRNGWLRFKVLDISPQEIEKALYRLTAIDSFGAEHVIAEQQNPSRGKALHVYGLNDAKGDLRTVVTPEETRRRHLVQQRLAGQSVEVYKVLRHITDFGQTHWMAFAEQGISDTAVNTAATVAEVFLIVSADRDFLSVKPEFKAATEFFLSSQNL